MAEGLGGYDYTFVESIPDDLVCLICTFVARGPQQLTCCGKIFCTSCLEGLGKDKPCPNCRKKEWKSFPDKRSSRSILSLRIKCSKSNKGCDWIGELREQDNHKKVCGYELIECENECLDFESQEPKKILRKDIATHLSDECVNRIVQCEYCNKIGVYSHITGDHLRTCPEALVRCTNEGCKEMIKRCQLQDGSHDCEYELVECKYAKYGCPSIAKKDKEEHEKDASLHLELTLKTIDGLTNRLDTLEAALNKIMDQNKKLEETHQISKSKQAELYNAVATIDQRVVKLHKSVKKLQQPSECVEPLSSAFDRAIKVATFKMTDFESHVKDKRAFHSPPFYLSHDSYKMKIIVQPTDNHLSIACEVVPGENDNYLPWPVNDVNIEIEVLNQRDRYEGLTTEIVLRRSYKVTFNTKPEYGSIVSRDVVQLRKLTKEYTRNDTLYFQVIVYDTHRARKSWLRCTI